MEFWPKMRGADEDSFLEDEEPSKFSWSVDPAAGASISDQGVFKASKPGKYRVSINLRNVNDDDGVDKHFVHSTITVTESSSGKTVETKDEKTRFYEDKPDGEPVQIFIVGSDLAVQNGGTPPSFTMNKDHWITELWTYHWNSGKGTPPGTIALKSAEGKIYGPWDVTLYNKVYWIAKPKMNLPAGKYTVIDSDPSTFAQNSETGGRGMAWMHGIPSK